MAESLDRLSELVRQAEAKSRAQKINVEMDNAVKQLHAAAERTRNAEKRVREVRPVRLKELEQADHEEQQLKELIKRLVQFKSQVDPNQDAEELIHAAQREVEIKRREAQTELAQVVRESEDARRELRMAIDEYQELRHDLDRLQPELVPSLAAEDKLVAEAELYFPSGQLQALLREVDAGVGTFDQLDSREQYAQLKIWIGRYRRLQTKNLTEEDQQLSRRIFGKLVGLSKEYEPGYIEAFQINFSTDWDAFVEEAEEQLRQATDGARRRRTLERQQEMFYSREHERHRQANQSVRLALDELKTALLRSNLPHEGAEQFREVLGRVVDICGADSPDVIDMVLPFRDLIDQWGEFPELRENLNARRRGRSEDVSEELSEDLFSVTEGKRVLLIGGSPRDDVRRSLEHIFGFETLEWEAYDETTTAEAMQACTQSIRSREVDLVMILKSHVGHHVPEKMRPLCKSQGIPCLIVEDGHGPAQIADALRRGLLKI